MDTRAKFDTEEPDILVQNAALTGENMILLNQLTRYRAVMEQAVEALASCEVYEDLSGDIRQGFSGSKCKNALTALREVLKEE